MLEKRIDGETLLHTCELLFVVDARYRPRLPKLTNLLYFSTPSRLTIAISYLLLALSLRCSAPRPSLCPVVFLLFEHLLSIAFNPHPEDVSIF